MNRTLLNVAMVALGLWGSTALADGPRGWGDGGWNRRHERREHGRRDGWDERRERERWERDRWQREQVAVAVTPAPTVAVPPAQQGGHYELRAVRRWVPGRYEQVWVPGTCAGYGYGRVCTQGSYQNVWRAGGYQDLQENVWVADPPCHDYGYGTPQVDPYSQNGYLAPDANLAVTAYAQPVAGGFQVQVPGFNASVNF